MPLVGFSHKTSHVEKIASDRKNMEELLRKKMHNIYDHIWFTSSLLRLDFDLSDYQDRFFQVLQERRLCMLAHAVMRASYVKLQRLSQASWDDPFILHVCCQSSLSCQKITHYSNVFQHFMIFMQCQSYLISDYGHISFRCVLTCLFFAACLFDHLRYPQCSLQALSGFNDKLHVLLEVGSPGWWNPETPSLKLFYQS